VTNKTLKMLVAAAFVRRAGYWAAARRQGTMAVLCYHRVGDQREAMDFDVSELEFTRQMQMLASSPYVAPVSATEFEAIWTGRRAYTERVPVLVSFDDGFRDNLTVAAPVLERYGIPAIVFVATDVLRGRPLWYHLVARLVGVGREPALSHVVAGLGVVPRAEGSPRGARHWVEVLLGVDGELFTRAIAHVERLGEDLDFDGQYFSPDDLQRWTALGMDVGAHTCSHPRLTAVGEPEAIREISDSKHALEDVIGRPVRHFAYPFGGREDISPVHAGALPRLGFTMAFTTVQGRNRVGCDPFAIRRKCINAKLFACPWTAFSETLFLADLMGLGAQLKELTADLLRGTRIRQAIPRDC